MIRGGASRRQLFTGRQEQEEPEDFANETPSSNDGKTSIVQEYVI